jgi:sugar phosphate isomerase/epimerase
MSEVSRRTFLETAGAGSVALGVLAASGVKLRANPLGLPIGSQTYPHRARIAAGEFPALLADMKAIGIEVIELCNPAYNEFKVLADGQTTRKMIDDAGLRCLSAHNTMGSLRNQQMEMIEWAHAIGMTQMATATLSGGVTNGLTSLDQIKYAAEEYNRIASVAKANGLQQVLHNEGFENSRLEDGRLTYPVLLEYLDPNLVKMQFQMSSMTTVGNPITYFENHPGRFISAHMQGVNLTGPIPSGPPDRVMPMVQEGAAGGRGRGGGGGRGGGRPGLGDDNVDWAAVFTAAKIGGMQNYFIEMGWEQTVASAAFLQQLEV